MKPYVLLSCTLFILTLIGCGEQTPNQLTPNHGEKDQVSIASTPSAELKDETNTAVLDKSSADQIVATWGKHQITQTELDDTLSLRLYDLEWARL